MPQNCRDLLKASWSQPVLPRLTKGKCMRTIKADSNKLKPTTLGETTWVLNDYAAPAVDPSSVPSIHSSNSQCL